MRTAVVTGAAGFIGRNLMLALGRRLEVEAVGIEAGDPPSTLSKALDRADIVIHLAGVNRPQSEDEFRVGNVESARAVVDQLLARRLSPHLLLASSTQATQENPYGRSKRQAEEIVWEYGRLTGAPVSVFRFPGVFGKWCRPNYNSVVATFCHNIARGLPVQASDDDREIELAYVDDVVAAVLRAVEGAQPAADAHGVCRVQPTYRVTLGRLLATLRSFSESRSTLTVPSLADDFVRKLYATYVSYLPEDQLAYPLIQRCDPRGVLVELLKSAHAGQVFVSRTVPGITRGNHYHDTKVEKFCVLSGRAVVRLRQVLGDRVVSYVVSGEQFQVIDIPPGYTHSIENVGQDDLLVLFWADEIFDPTSPDTYVTEVTRG